MIFVLDASALTEYVLRTPLYAEVRRFIEDENAECHVPALCDVEIVSVLRGALLAHRLTVERANEALQAYCDLPLTRHQHLALLARILELRQNFSPYDAAYVSLCELLGGSFVTGDRPLARAVRDHLEIAVAWPDPDRKGYRRRVRRRVSRSRRSALPRRSAR